MKVSKDNFVKYCILVFPFLYFLIRLQMSTSSWYKILHWLLFHHRTKLHSHTLTAHFPAEQSDFQQSEPCMLSWSCDARGAVMLNELTTVLLSGTFSWRPLVLLSPEAGLWIMHVRAQALSGLRHIHRSCYLSWHILSESQVNMSPAGLCYTRLKPPQTDSGFKSRAEQRK